MIRLTGNTLIQCQGSQMIVNLLSFNNLFKKCLLSYFTIIEDQSTLLCFPLRRLLGDIQRN